MLFVNISDFSDNFLNNVLKNPPLMHETSFSIIRSRFFFQIISKNCSFFELFYANKFSTYKFQGNSNIFINKIDDFQTCFNFFCLNFSGFAFENYKTTPHSTHPYLS